MGAELDRLEIAVEAQATKASNQLDILVRKLDRVSASLSGVNSRGLATMGSGVNKLANAMNNFANNTKTTDFSRLSRNLSTLASVDTSKFSRVAGGITQLTTAINSIGNISDNALQVAEFSKSISKLGNKSVQTAIANLPALATAMNNFMATMARAPQVSHNIIQMTRALADLAAQGSKVGTVSNSLTQNVNRVGNAMSANTRKAKGFAFAIGSFYQKFYWVKRGINKLWDSVENSMSYVENLNYFNAALGQVADKAVSQWQSAGYSSADAYYNSFSDRAKELTSKMTGFNVNDDGTLTATGGLNLGINPSKLMNYQAMFAQMSSSMGVASETSLKLSQALTEIGADLASVKNMDFDKVWKDMASGLAGMSRTLDKYGVNIRNVNLQQKLFDLGIEENITNLNQNDKALLRAIILLDNTRYAWGDLADTLNQPANQMRLLTSNLSNLSRTIGNLFLPVVSKVLPYVNGLVIALQRLVTWIGNMMGVDLSEITSGIGSSEVDISELLGETDDLGDSLDDASAAAKKLKSNLQGFDELNVITTQTEMDTSGLGAGLSSGLLDSAFEKAFSEYQKAWDEAFAKMENRADAFADRIEKYFQPIKDIISDLAIGDFFAAGQDTSNLVAGILNFFSEAIDNVDWYGIGENIGDYLAGLDWIKILGSVGRFVWEAFKASLEVWVGALSTAPIETALISLMSMPGLLKAITASKFVTGIGKLADKFKLLGKSFSNFVKTPNIKTFGEGIGVICNNMSTLGKITTGILGVIAEFLLVKDGFYELTTGSDNLVVSLGKVAAGAGFAVGALKLIGLSNPWTALITGITGVIAAFAGMDKAAQEALEKFAEEQELSVFGERVADITNKIQNSSDAIRDRIEASKEYVNSAGLAETEMTKDLADRYFDLSEKERLTNDEKAEMKTLAEKLVETLPELQQYYNTETGLIDTTRDSVNNLINARLREIRLNAAEEQLTESYKTRTDALKNLGEAADSVQKAQDELTNLYNEYETAVSRRDATLALKEIDKLIALGVEDMSELSEAQKLLNQFASAGVEPVGKLEDAYEKLFDIATNQGTEGIPSVFNLNDSISQTKFEIDNLMKSYETLTDSFYGAKEVYEEAENSVEDMSRIVSEGMQGAGEETVDSYTNSILDKISDVEDTMEKLGHSSWQAFHDSEMDFGSPSKAMIQFGKDTVDGYNLGVSNNTSSTLNTIARYMNSVKQAFSVLPNILLQVGVQSMRGLLSGISSMEGAIYNKTNSIAGNIVRNMQTALKLSGDLYYEIASTPQFSYAGVPSEVLATTEYSNYSYYENQNNYDTTQTNELLREVLGAVRAGQVIECNGKEIGRTVREEDVEYYNRTGKGMFEH